MVAAAEAESRAERTVESGPIQLASVPIRGAMFGTDAVRKITVELADGRKHQLDLPNCDADLSSFEPPVALADLSPTKQRIVRFIAPLDPDDPTKGAVIASALGLKPTAIRRDLSELVKADVLGNIRDGEGYFRGSRFPQDVETQ